MHQPVEVRANQSFIRAIEIRQAVQDIASDVVNYEQHLKQDPDHQFSPLVTVAVMNGALNFAADLQAALWYKGVPTEFTSVTASRYGNKTTSDNPLVIEANSKIPVQDRHILLMDTIVDQGVTLQELVKFYCDQGAASVAAVTLIRQMSQPQSERVEKLPLISVGFVEKFGRWFAGYGIDYLQQLRQLTFLKVGTRQEFEDWMTKERQVASG